MSGVAGVSQSIPRPPSSTRSQKNAAERRKKRREQELHDRKVKEYNEKYGGLNVDGPGERPATIKEGSACYNTTNDDYTVAPHSKAFGMNVHYDDGTILWKPLFDGVNGLSPFTSRAPGDRKGTIKTNDPFGAAGG